MAKSSRGDNRSFVPKDSAPKHGPGRHAMSPAKSQSDFTRNASRTHYKNMPTRLPMRGGIRL